MRYLIQFKSLTAITPSPKLEMYAEPSNVCAKHRLDQTKQYYQKLKLPLFFNSYLF